MNQHANAGGARPRWFHQLQHIYLDASVFRSDEVLGVLGGDLARDLRAWHAACPQGRLVLHEGSGLGLSPAAQAAFNALRALPYTEWVALDSPHGRHPVSEQIAAACLGRQGTERQAVFTQDEALADRIVANASSPADRSSRPVGVRCLLPWRHLDWDAYRRVGRPATLDQLPHAPCMVVDTCSWMLMSRGDGQPAHIGLAFFERILPELRQRGTRLVLLQEVLDELHHMRNSRDEQPAQAAAAALDWLALPEVAAICDTRARSGGQRGHADPVIVQCLVELGAVTDLCVVTQDHDNAARLLANLPGPPRRCWVVRIDNRGRFLLDWRGLPGKREQAPAPADGQPSAPAPAPTPAPDAPDEPPARPAASPPPVASPPPPPSPPVPPPGAVNAIVPVVSVQSRLRPAPAAKRRTVPLLVGALLAVAVAAGLWRQAAQSGPGPAQAAAALLPVQLDLLTAEGVVQPLAGGMAQMAQGTRFQVRMTPRADGELELLAIGSDADPASVTLLMRQTARAGAPVLSPMLRIQGAPGADRLGVQFRPADDAAPQRQDLVIVHD